MVLAPELVFSWFSTLTSKEANKLDQCLWVTLKCYSIYKAHTVSGPLQQQKCKTPCKCWCYLWPSNNKLVPGKHTMKAQRTGDTCIKTYMAFILMPDTGSNPENYVTPKKSSLCNCPAPPQCLAAFIEMCLHSIAPITFGSHPLAANCALTLS